MPTALRSAAALRTALGLALLLHGSRHVHQHLIEARDSSLVAYMAALSLLAAHKRAAPVCIKHEMQVMFVVPAGRRGAYLVSLFACIFGAAGILDAVQKSRTSSHNYMAQSARHLLGPSFLFALFNLIRCCWLPVRMQVHSACNYGPAHSYLHIELSKMCTHAST